MKIKKENMEILLNMKLHDEIRIELCKSNRYVYILRVANGWVYDYGNNTVFVPEKN